MCGIVGWLSTSPAHRVEARRSGGCGTRSRTAGPTGPGSGSPPTGEVGLGFRRLAIVDLSADANQPMTNEDGARPGRLQRRDLQPRGAPQGAPGEGPPLPDRPLRHRDDRPRLRGVGAGSGRPPPRHVRARDLGRAPSAGSSWPATASGVKPLYFTWTRARLPLRLRDQGAAARTPRSRPTWSRARGLPLPLLPDDARAAHDVPRASTSCPPAAARSWSSDGRMKRGGLLGRAPRPRARICRELRRLSGKALREFAVRRIAAAAATRRSRSA